MYVYEKDVEDNRVVLSDNQALFSKELTANDFNWVSIERPDEPIRANVRIRYSHREAPATIYPTEDGIKVIFDEPQRGITKGQSAVLYDGEVLLGGGVIV